MKLKVIIFISLFTELGSGKKSRGSPHRRFKNQLNSTKLRTETDPVSWEMEAAE